MNIWGYWSSYGMVGGCFTDVMIYSSVNYHQAHALHAATEPRRLCKNVAAACGAVMLRFHGVIEKV